MEKLLIKQFWLIAVSSFPSVDEKGDEESEEPPKPEVKEVKEDDAFYSKKYDCKYIFDWQFRPVSLNHLFKFMWLQWSRSY